jgi:uncharacterized protein YjiS (DUF1127 family)
VSTITAPQRDRWHKTAAKTEKRTRRHSVSREYQGATTMSADTMNYATRTATALDRASATLVGQTFAVLSNMTTAMLAWQERARHRRELAELDDRTLADVGLTRADIDQQVARPFWFV